MQTKAEEFIEKNHLIVPGDKLIVGVSGGADSVCLFRVLLALQKKMDFSMTVVHVHHGIRKDEADSDMAFVQELCRTWEVAYRGFRIDVPGIARADKISIEEAGRNARYRIFEEVRKKEGADKIAVAHHADDNAETILMNLFRGSGIKGLSGMRPRRERLIRPLLCVKREEIEQYLAGIHQPYCVDSTNAFAEYTRNRIRGQLLPIAKEVNRRAAENIADAGTRLSDIEDYLEEQTEKAYQRVQAGTNTEPNRCFLQSDRFAAEHIVIQKRIVRKACEAAAGSLADLTSEHVEQVLALFDKEAGKQISLPYQTEAKKLYDGVVIERKREKADAVSETRDTAGEQVIESGVYPWRGEELLIVSVGTKQDFFAGKDAIKIIKNEKDSYTKWFDYDKIKDTLLLRTVRPGDFLVINESGDRKKLNRYFIDKKIPREERGRLPVLADGNHVLWVPGLRSSEGALVTETTEQILKIEWRKA